MEPIRRSTTDPDPSPRGPTRIVAIKSIQDAISLDDIDRLRDDIIQNLRDDGGQVTIEIKVIAENPDGFSERTASAIRENSSLLGLRYQPDDPGGELFGPHSSVGDD